MRYRYYTCDVFTNSRFGGNPLAVLPAAAGLTTEAMQNIAREFNFSETTFVLEPEQGHTRRVRIFTPAREVPFAGHPNVGTAFVLAKIGDIEVGTPAIFEEKAGLVPVDVRSQDDSIWCELKTPQSIEIGKAAPVELVAQCLSLDPAEILIDKHPPQEVSAGLPFLVVELRDESALAKAVADTTRIQQLHESGIAADILVYVARRDSSELEVRMFAPLDGVPEDPATGSANCALVGMLTQNRSLDDGEYQWQIRQGDHMGRPSHLFARTQVSKGQLDGIWIGGTCVMVCEGTIECG